MRLRRRYWGVKVRWPDEHEPKTRRPLRFPAINIPKGPAARAWLLIGLAVLIVLLQLKLVSDLRYVRRHVAGPIACEAGNGLPVWQSSKQDWDCMQRA